MKKTDAEQFKTLLQKIDNINLLNFTIELRNDTSKDGSEWIIGAIKDNKYHMITSWTAAKEIQGNFRSVGEYLILI